MGTNTKLREEIESGPAIPRWPAGWPDVSGFSWRWFLLTRDVLPTKEIDKNGVTIRSVQLLKYTLRPDSGVSDLVSALDTPPSPPAGTLRDPLDYVSIWGREGGDRPHQRVTNTILLSVL